MDNAQLLVVIVVAAVGVFIVVAAGLKIVSQFEKGLIERFGRYNQTVDPGLRWIWPFIERIRRVDMREQVVDVPPQEVITEDNVVVTVDAVVYYRATDPVKLRYNVANFILAATKLAQTNLRNIIGDMDLDEALTSREAINTQLRQVLDEATDVWGTQVVRVEIQRIDPPPDVTEAMHRQMKAERDRRAIVTEAEGDKTAQILRAEGVKQSRILEAQGQAQAIREVADADKFKLLTVAEGEGQAIERVFARHPHRQPEPRPHRHPLPRRPGPHRRRQGQQGVHTGGDERGPEQHRGHQGDLHQGRGAEGVAGRTSSSLSRLRREGVRGRAKPRHSLRCSLPSPLGGRRSRFGRPRRGRLAPSRRSRERPQRPHTSMTPPLPSSSEAASPESSSAAAASSTGAGRRWIQNSRPAPATTTSSEYQPLRLRPQ